MRAAPRETALCIAELTTGVTQQLVSLQVSVQQLVSLQVSVLVLPGSSSLRYRSVNFQCSSLCRTFTDSEVIVPTPSLCTMKQTEAVQPYMLVVASVQAAAY
jgi:hypothetical protein